MTITSVCAAARTLIEGLTPCLLPDDVWLQALTQGPLGDEDDEAWMREPCDAVRVFAVYPLTDQQSVPGSFNGCMHHVSVTIVVETLYRYCPTPDVEGSYSPHELAAQDAEDIAALLVEDLHYPNAPTVREVEPQGRYPLERLGEPDDHVYLQTIEIQVTHAVGGT